MKAHYKRKNRFKKRRVNYRCDDHEDFLDDEDFMEDDVDDLFDDYDDSKEVNYRSNAKPKYVPRKNSKMFYVASSIVLVLVVISVLAFKFVNSKALSNLSTINSKNLSGSVLEVNNHKIDLSSPILIIREVSSSNDSSMIEKFLGTKSSNMEGLIKSLDSGRVNFSKVANLVLYEITNEEYSLYSSDYLKVRYSDLNDGYLLEVNNKTRKSISVDYLYTGELCEKGTEGSSTLVLKSGLTQIFLDSSINVDSLARSLASYKK